MTNSGAHLIEISSAYSDDYPTDDAMLSICWHLAPHAMALREFSGIVVEFGHTVPEAMALREFSQGHHSSKPTGEEARQAGGGELSLTKTINSILNNSERGIHLLQECIKVAVVIQIIILQFLFDFET
eukprot:scaffold14046_cov76-Cyclotella_meneghiniana.AAC.3